MKELYLGKVTNTHGLSGEIRILSDFKYKKEVFLKGNIIYINDNKYTIKSYRMHKEYDMVTLDGISSIDEAQSLKGYNVYINRENYSFSGVLNEDIIGLSVYDNSTYKGKVIDILKSEKYDLFVIDGIKRHMVPNIPEFVKNIDLKNGVINIEYIRGLDNEN